MRADFVPLLLGNDINAYSMARAFHEAYGVKTLVYGMYASGPCCGSSIIDYRICPKNDDPEVVLRNVQTVCGEYPDRKVLVLGCGDNYLTAIAENLPHFPGNAIAPYVDLEKMEGLIHKARFYELCARHDIGYPATFVYQKEMGHDFTLPFDAPYVVKPAESATYWDHPFSSQKKAYILHSRAEVEQVVDEIYANGYGDDLIIQDFIPGDDSNMRVLTSYSGEDGTVRLMCLGHVLLEEHTPHAVGNHAVIVTEHEPALCETMRRLLDAIAFTGFSNFDIKYDCRDGTYKVFELNCRQGRSNYYVTGAGYNLARWLVEDRIDHKSLPFTIAAEKSLWRVVPKKVAYTYIAKEHHAVMDELAAAEGAVNPIFYAADKGKLRKLRMLRNHWRYNQLYAAVMEKAT